MRTIPNSNPTVPTRITLTTPMHALCPHTGEPQRGSTLAIIYSPAAGLLELHTVEEWLQTQLTEALDVETLTQRAAQAASAAAGVPVSVIARYILRNGLELVCECQSLSTAPEKIEHLRQ